jgi:Tfp pilus assembly protein PilF
MKIKENLMDNAGIIFVSGVYRDRAFANEAISKTGALDYITKPFDANAIFAKLDKKLNTYVEAPKLSLHNLLASPYASNRDRRKALDQVEDMIGFDLPFVFSILMDSESSGYLNIIDNEENIYGVTFSKGALVKVDSEANKQLTKNIIIQQGFVTNLELQEIKDKNIKNADLIKSMVEESLISPHAAQLVRKEASLLSALVIINDKHLKINFVPDRQLKADSDNIDFKTFLPTLHDMVDNVLTFSWLKKFYSVWSGHAIKQGPQFSDFKQINFLPVFQKVPDFISNFKNEITIEEIIAKNSQYSEEAILKALHLMMLRRMLVFESAKRVNNFEEHIGRIKSIYQELKAKNPVEIFLYFGLGPNPKVIEVNRIYKEFARSHHPDLLPATVAADIKTLNHELFSLVTAAYEIMGNEEKKAKYFAESKKVESEKQIKSDELVTAAAKELNRGHYAEALTVLEQAAQLYESERCVVHLWWAQLKIENKLTDKYVQEIDEKLRALSAGTKKSALWAYLNGLIKRRRGDSAGAESEFIRTLQMDDKFTDARRELVSLKNSQPKKVTTEDILTGDISVVIKGLFSKKKKGA